jgi:transposase
MSGSLYRQEPLTINNMDIEVALQKVEKLLSGEKGMSPAMRSMVELLVLLITLLAGRLNLSSCKSFSDNPNRRKESKSKGERKAGETKGS